MTNPRDGSARAALLSQHALQDPRSSAHDRWAPVMRNVWNRCDVWKVLRERENVEENQNKRCMPPEPNMLEMQSRTIYIL